MRPGNWISAVSRATPKRIEMTPRVTAGRPSQRHGSCGPHFFGIDFPTQGISDPARMSGPVGAAMADEDVQRVDVLGGHITSVMRTTA